MNQASHAIFLALCTVLCVCRVDAQDQKPVGPVSDRFGEFWYQGKAEITSYDLEQARYNDTHTGHAVLIFVTEDFSKSKQVKLDDPDRVPEDRLPVLKLNLTNKFNTGIYPYSIMTSVFTPLDRKKHKKTVKVSTSVQEWCGHTFVQLNFKEDAYSVQQNSYFERRGDQTLSIPGVTLEDEIWNTIRLNPEDLPLGEVEMIPGTIFQRLGSSPWRAQTASTTLEAADGNPGQMVYSIHYAETDRTLDIRFNKAFPHEIESWEDTYPASRWRGGKMTTRAVRKKRMWLDYWSRNGVDDLALRHELELE